MKVSVYRIPRGDPSSLPQLLDEVVEEARQAERYGFDSFFVTEHHCQPDRLSSVMMLCAAIASHTTRIRVGTSVLILPLYHPVHLAEEISLLDVMSGGRFVFGFGTGYVEEDFKPFGVPFRERVSRTKEGLEILRLAWTEERFSYSGRHYDLSDVSVYPKPVQVPHPPLLMGAWTDPGVQRAAEWGVGWIPDDTPNITEIRYWASMYREGRDRVGPAPLSESIVMQRDVWLASTTEGLSEFARLVTEYLWFYVQHGLFRERFDPWIKDVKSERDLVFERLNPESRFIFGSPEDCVRQLKRWEDETGVDHVAVSFRLGLKPSHERVMEAIQVFGEKVLPHVAGDESKVAPG